MPDDAPTLDLSALDFGPAWAKDPGSSSPPPVSAPREPRSPRPGKRPGGGAPGKFPRKPQRGQGPRGPKDRHRTDGPRRDNRPPPPPPNPFPWLRLAFTATEPAVETVARQIRQTGKTFSLFDLARILLRNPASYTVDLSSAPPPPEGPFYVTPSDGGVWMTMENAVRHLLHTRLQEFYRTEIVEIEAPKGNFPVVAVCGMSGTLLGPPNHHSFERRLRELHRGRFSRMDFEQFRSRLKMERDPELVEKWRSEASKVTVYHPFQSEGGESEGLPDVAAVEKHFTAHHAPTLVEFVPTARVPGDPKKAFVDPALAPLLNHACAEEERFPLRLAQSLSRALSAAGLRFHKSQNRTTFVSAARPHHLNLDEVVVSDSIRKILETIRGRKSMRRHELLEHLAPLPTPPESQNIPEAAPAQQTVEESPEPAAQESYSGPESVPTESGAPVSPEISPEQAAREATVQDLLWLTHEGYVIEYADGRLESVPPPKNPPKPAPRPVEEPVPVSQEQQPEA